MADPAGSNAVVAAVQWLQGTLLGTVATTVAVISVAAVGLMMLSGRVDLRRGGSVILGCFVLLGASSIAGGIRSVTEGDFGPVGAGPVVAPVAWQAPPRPVAPVAPWLQAPPQFQPRQRARDPFAGAAVPSR
jgi:type IV secretion system protein VirB2